MRKEILRRVFLGELKQNLDTVGALYRLSKRAAHASEDDKKAALGFIRNGTSEISNELHRRYYESQRILIDELDPARKLFNFYERVSRANQFSSELDFETATANLGLGVTTGTEILATQAVTYIAPLSDF